MFYNEDLKKYVHFECSLKKILGADYVLEEAAAEYASSNKIKLNDIIIACKNMYEAKVSPYDFNNWASFINYVLNENFALSDKYDEVDTMALIIPTNDEEIMLCLYDMILELYDNDDFEYEFLQEIIHTAKCYKNNKKKEKSQWEYADWQKEKYISYIDENINDEKFTKEELDLFYKLVEEGCASDNHEALHIKGYGCYGGSSLFECDWQEAKKCIEKLFEITGNGLYANSLGYIYYYGRCEDEPNYDKAFQYFSVGAFQGIVESMYKVADMFVEGKGIVRNDLAAAKILTNLYENAYELYINGDTDAKFADIAYRLGKMLAKEADNQEEYISAYIYFLQAVHGIERRMAHDDFFGNKKVLDNINKGLKEIKEKIEPDFFAKEQYIDADIYFMEFIQQYDIKVKILEQNEEEVKVRLKRKAKPDTDMEANMLLIVPELEKAILTDTLIVRFNKVKKMRIYSDKNSFKVDNIVLNRESKWVFYNEDDVMFEIKSDMIRLYKKDMKDTL